MSRELELYKSHELERAAVYVDGFLVEGFERRTIFHPAWDKRDPDPHKNYGTHGVELRMILIGPKGATQFVMHLGWHWIKTPALDYMWPLPVDLGYHSPVPLYEEHLGSRECDVLPGGFCYYDGSGLNAERVYNEIMLHEGSDGIWKELLRYYIDLFGDLS